VRQSSVNTQFVDFIPDILEEGTLYISDKYSIASHKCCCGCGSEVVTPLSPTDWQIKRVGRLVSLHPSIGNWSFPCRSHYYIKSNRVQWAGDMRQEDINAGIAIDRQNKAHYYASRTRARGDPCSGNVVKPRESNVSDKRPGSWWSRLWSSFVEYFLGRYD